MPGVGRPPGAGPGRSADLKGVPLRPPLPWGLPAAVAEEISSGVVDLAAVRMTEMNRFARWMVNRGAPRRARRLLARLEGHLALPPGSAILELGAGRGALSALLIERFRPRRAVVTDYDPRQVEAARAFLDSRPAGRPDGVELRTADALELPFEDRAFDAVFAIGMLHHVDSSPREYRRRPAALAEIRRVLAPGGLLVYSDFSQVPELRRSLDGLGMVREYGRPGWLGRELAVYRRPTDAPRG